MVMEILGDICDISIKKGEAHKIKIRTVDEKDVIVDKVELHVGDNGKIELV